MGTPNPMAGTYSAVPSPVSKTSVTVAGILTTVHGLEELQQGGTEVACLWLLNPRQQSQASMEPIAAAIINDWNRHLTTLKEDQRSLGLIAISFDQRNHGSREVDKMANEAWRAGNEKHAQDMLGIYHGTSLDTSQLITYMPSYVFPRSERTIINHMVLGVSLGGHAAWHCIVHDPRIKTAVIVIGCPDYAALMSDRARLSKLVSWTQSDGSRFFGSEDFPPSLIEAVERFDPAGLFLGSPVSRQSSKYDEVPKGEEKQRLSNLMKALDGKRILSMAGGADKLVPYSCCQPFHQWLQRATQPGGWFGGKVAFEEIVFDGVGHEMSPGMGIKASQFINDSLKLLLEEVSRRSSKI